MDFSVPATQSNCLIWALGRVLREGGSLIISRSRFGPWSHVRWLAPDGRVLYFRPVCYRATIRAWRITIGGFRLNLPPLVYKGRPAIWGRIEKGKRDDAG